MQKIVLNNGVRLLYKFKDIEHTSFCIHKCLPEKTIVLECSTGRSIMPDTMLFYKLPAVDSAPCVHNKFCDIWFFERTDHLIVIFSRGIQPVIDQIQLSGSAVSCKAIKVCFYKIKLIIFCYII